ncbi:hypothetical protein FRC06_006615 [Ceratobasidium sp. 370]|nr:hypothetical protein FRC06_006615 [Ceratobasidium sp. 370]
MGIASDDDASSEAGFPPLPSSILDEPNPGDVYDRPATPPIAPRVRRRRSTDSSGSTPVSEHQKRRRLEFANKLCDQVGVTPLQRSQVAAHSQLSTHDLILTIYTQGLAVKAVPGEQYDFSKSRVFKEFITPRLHATVLDANIDAYVTGVTERFVKHIRVNYQTYHLERSDLAEFAFNKSCNTAVSGLFTAYRSDIKKKFFESLDSQVDIGTLAESFNMENYQMTREHWGRYAVIRSYVSEYQKEKREDRKTGSFWSYIDKKLARIRQGLLKHPEPERAARLKKKIDKALTLDQQKYPFVPDENDPTSRPPVVVDARFSDVPDWQLACETSLLEMQGDGSGSANPVDPAIIANAVIGAVAEVEG